MNKKYRVIVSIVLLFVLATTFTIGGLKMQNVYGNTYFVPGDEIFKDVVTYSSSNTHSLYVSESGAVQKLFVKGNNTYGQLGTKDYNDYLAMTQILIDLPDSKITKVWSLTNASFIQTIDGKLYAAGNNNNRKLGVSAEENTINIFSEVLLPSEAVGHVIDVQGNGNFTIFKTDIGKFYGCGDNSYGQLGFSNSITKSTDVNGSPVVEIGNGLLDGSGNPVVIKDMAAGKDFTVLIDDSQDGNVYFTGNNNGSFSNGAKQSATDFLPNTVFGFAFVTDVKQYDKCDFHVTLAVSPNNFYIYASDENYAVVNGMIVTPEFKSRSYILNNYVLGDEIFPEIYMFSAVYESIDVTKFPVAFEGLDLFGSDSFSNIIGGNNGVHGIKYADFIMADNGDYQLLQNKKDFKLFNEGLLFWLKSNNTNHTYMSYFGNNDAGSPNYIPWLKNTGLQYIEEHQVSIGGGNTTITNVSASQKMLLYSATNGTTDALFGAGDNSNGLLNPLESANFIDISTFNVMSSTLAEIQYPFYIADISPAATSFSMNSGEQKTVTFNSIKRPKLTISVTSKTTGKSVPEIATYTTNKNDDGTLSGIDVTAVGAGVVTIEVHDDMKVQTKLFEMTFNVTAPTQYNMSFEDNTDTVEIGKTIDVVFLAGPEFTYGTDFELRINKNNIYSFSAPTLLGTTSENLTRYYTTIVPLTPTADTADLEIWVLGQNTQCVASKTIKVVEPVVNKIDIAFAANIPTSINVGDSIDVTQYVTPVSEATNMTYTIMSGNALLSKITSTIGTFKGMAAGTATIRINHPNGITPKDFILTINQPDVVPPEEVITINSSTSSINFKVGESTTLVYTTTPSGKESEVVMSSDDTQVCTVNPLTKTVSAVGVGTTYVRLTSPKTNIPVSIPVTVTSNLVLDVSQTLTVKTGETVQIPVAISPESERANLVYTSSNLNIGVAQDGRVTGITAGTSIVTVRHTPTNTSKTIVITIIQTSTGDGGNTNPTTPQLVFGNTLNTKGELEVTLGGKITLSANIINYNGSASIIFASGDSTKALVTGTTLEGKSLGKTTLVVATNATGVQPLVISVSVVKASYGDGEINLNLDEIKNEQQEQEKDINAKITLKQYEKYKINVSGYVKDADLDKYFDDYFVVKTTEKYVSYLGNGVVRANYPGESTLYIYKSGGVTLVGKVTVVIPYPTQFFNEMPSATGIPFNRTIRITFNQNILTSSITNASVFVQDKADGNGTMLNRTVSVSKNVLNITVPLAEEDSTKATKTVYIYITPDVKSTSNISVFSPMVIPVTFIN